MSLERYNAEFKSVVEKIEDLNFDEVFARETHFEFKKRFAPCPFCGSGTSGRQDSDGAFHHYPSLNIGKCFSCGTSAGIVKLVMHEHSLVYREAIHYIAKEHLYTILEHPSEKFEISAKPKRNIQLSERKQISEEERLQEEAESRRKFDFIKGIIIDNPKRNTAEDYLLSRNINPAFLPENCFYEAHSYNKLPAGVVFFDSEMRCLNKRYIGTVPEGVAKAFTFGQMKNSLFDACFREEADSLYITEGVINAMSIFQSGYSAVALFATTNEISDFPKFRKYFDGKDIAVAFDGDKAGRQSAVKLAGNLFSNFSPKSVSILDFPEKEDANDLLKSGTLEAHLGDRFNYIYPTKHEISEELKKIEADRKNYFPALKPKNYFKRPAVAEIEKDGSLTFKQNQLIPAEVLSRLGVPSQELAYFRILFLDEYTLIENGIAHIHKSTQEYPIFILESGADQVIWRPFSPKPYNEIEIYGADSFRIGLTQLEAEHTASQSDSEEDEESENKGKKTTVTGSGKLWSAVICYNLTDLLNLRAVGEYPLYFHEDSLSSEAYEEITAHAAIVYQVPTHKPQDREKARALAHKFIEIRTFFLPDRFQNFAEYIDFYSPSYFKRQLNTALPLKFWEYDSKKDGYDLNVITLWNFLNNHGYFTYPSLKQKGGYQYIKIAGRIVKSMDKENFQRHVKTFVDDYLSGRGENIKLRNKISVSNRFTEANLSGLKQLSLDFENSGRGWQNWFFADKSMWIVSKQGIKRCSQKILKKYVWEDEMLNYPSKVLEAPFNIFKKARYQKLLSELNSLPHNSEERAEKMKELAKLRPIDKYDIEITDRNHYFLQFLWATSYAHFERAEETGYFLKPEDFWYNFPIVTDAEGNDKPLFSDDEISEMKLHLINKITWLGYYMKDFREPHEDFGLAILDAVDEIPGIRNKGAAGGGKSLITKAIREVKPTLIIKAEREDFAVYPFRYSAYEKEKIIVCDDMHKNSKIGDMLTDFSDGLVINRKHQQEVPLAFRNSPKIIITRNYIDDEGERVDRRLGRMFVFPFFHDNKSGRFRNRRKPADWFGRQLFIDDTEEDKAKLVNFFAYAYIANLNFGEIHPPMQNMEAFRIAKRIGEPLIEFLDEYLDDASNLGYIDKVPFYTQFLDNQRFNMSPYQRSNVYNTAQKFKNLVAEYCKIRNLVFNPVELLTDGHRILKTSEIQKNKHGNLRTTEFIYINTKERFSEELRRKQNRPEPEPPTKPEPVQMELPEPVAGDDMPF